MDTVKYMNEITGALEYGIARTESGIELHVTDEQDGSISVDFYASCFGVPLHMNYLDQHEVVMMHSIKEIIHVIEWRLGEEM